MDEGQDLKTRLIARCAARLDERVATIRTALASIATARNKETKSSAGDKFETGRAMLQLETDKLNRQLAAALRERDTLERVAPGASAATAVRPGSLVATNRGLYFLAVGIGRLQVDGRTVYCTSLDAPVGKALLGKKVGDSANFNELEFTVRGIA